MLPLEPILLVDDDSDCVDQAQRLLRKAGIPNPVMVRHSGEDAITFLTQCSRAAGTGGSRALPLLLLDLRMPGIDGLEVLRWLRRRKSFQATRVILWSDSVAPEQVEAAHRCGADALFTKFPNAALLGAAIRAALDLFHRDAGAVEEPLTAPRAD